MSEDRLTRIQLLRRGAAAGVILIVPPSVLAACGGGGGAAATTGVTTGGGSQKLPSTIQFSNWTLYMDSKQQTLKEFKKKYGSTISYHEDINDNATYFGKIQGALSNGQSIDRDIIVLTDNSRFPGELIRKGWAEKIDKSALPNFKNLQPALRHPGFDPNRDYSMPWASGMTGIASNLSQTKKSITSVDELLNDPKLHGKVTLLTEMADTMSLVMLANGDNPAKVTDQTFNAALKTIKKSVDSGQVRQFTGNDYTGPLAKGDLAACMSWSGDVVQLLPSNHNLVWNLPDSGGDIWTDNMMIPKGGNVYAASTVMNWFYDPRIAAQLAIGGPGDVGINYITPVVGAKEAAVKINPKEAKNQLIFPDAQTLSQVHIFDADALINEDYLKQWQNLITS